MAMQREKQEAEERLVTVRDALRQHTETITRSERHKRCLAPLGRRRLTLERALKHSPPLPRSRHHFRKKHARASTR